MTKPSGAQGQESELISLAAQDLKRWEPIPGRSQQPQSSSWAVALGQGAGVLGIVKSV